MMVPASPCANFIIRKPSFTLDSFKTILYTMFSLDNSRLLLQSSVNRCIRKIIVILNFSSIINRAGRYQKFFCRLMATPFALSNNISTYPLLRQKTGLSKVDSSPCIKAVGVEGARTRHCFQAYPKPFHNGFDIEHASVHYTFF